MMRRTVGGCGVLVGASGMGVSEPVAVGPLGEVVTLRWFLVLAAL